MTRWIRRLSGPPLRFVVDLRVECACLAPKMAVVTIDRGVLQWHLGGRQRPGCVLPLVLVVTLSLESVPRSHFKLASETRLSKEQRGSRRPRHQEFDSNTIDFPSVPFSLKPHSRVPRVRRVLFSELFPILELSGLLSCLVPAQASTSPLWMLLMIGQWTFGLHCFTWRSIFLYTCHLRCSSTSCSSPAHCHTP